MKVIGIIPARGGSKGIPNKNMVEIQGKPLVSYSIEVGLLCPQIDEVMVSTDNSTIARISTDAGAQVPFLRPPHLASDTSATIDTLIHVVGSYEQVGVYFDAICLLQPTTPFRSLLDLNRALEIFKEAEADSLVSVRKVPHVYNPHWTFEKNKEGYLSIATGDEEIIIRRQELPPSFHRDGAIYITRRDVLMDNKSIYGTKVMGYEMSHSPNINIDTFDDLDRAKTYASDLARQSQRSSSAANVR